MSITKDQIIEAVAAMSVMDVVELVSAMEEKFGVSAAAAVAVAAGPAEAAEEKERILLQDRTFYIGIRAFIPHEAECGGTGRNLYPVHLGAGDAVQHSGPLCGNG